MHKEDKPKEKDAEKKEDAGIPAPPECDPALGDLTLEYVAWAKKHQSKDDFEARYANRLPEDWEAQLKEQRKEEKEKE